MCKVNVPAVQHGKVHQNSQAASFALQSADTAYSGGQQNWPVASGSFVSQKYGLPVYFGPPDRPYRVLGYMETQSAPLAVWETGKSESIKPAVKEAIKHGADALVLLASGTKAGLTHSPRATCALAR